MKSSTGASHAILQRLHSGQFEVALSVSLLIEYQDVISREEMNISISRNQRNDIIDRICYLAMKQEIYFLWRPFLRDPKDDLVLEVAVASRSRYIVTFNTRDFRGVHEYGIKAVTPSEFLKLL